MSTYQPIASVTLSSAQSSVTFSGIPQTYTDLVLVVAGTHTGSGVAGLYVSSINGDTGANYSRTLLQGNGSTASSARGSSETDLNIGLIGSTQANSIFHFMNYSNSTTNKTILARGNDSSALVRAAVALWRNTAAITSFTLSGVTFSSGTTFNLYGVANASITNVAKATGGDSVYTDGTYWYHIFRSSGTFTPTQALTADYLVVAGGGGAGGGFSIDAAGGGGGAGGLRCTVTATGGGGSLESALSLTASTNYTVTVGAGGAGGTGGVRGTTGNNSVFSSITSSGGGGGGAYIGGGNGVGLPGGSGGGGGNRITQSERLGGAGTVNQGYAGATGSTYQGPAGGGGGAGAAATTKDGATGVATAISGTSTTYAGGGGAGGGNTTPGTGGSGGGGSGSGNGNGTAGTANTGGGGGGASTDSGGPDYTGGAGGSGIVIVRYAA